MITYKGSDINFRGMNLRDYLQMWWYRLKGREIIWLLTNVVQ
jgi:hypothetical protein